MFGKLALIISILLSATCSYGQEQKKILIAAASDMKFALDSVITAFEILNPGSRVDVAYGSSGKLYEQILHSAPFDLFFSADIEYPLTLKEKGLVISDVFTYGVGRIVIWTQLVDPNKMRVLTLTDESISKIAIANPRHAPYGRRAEEALRYYNIYDQIKSKLVYGENISQTAQFVTAGAAEAGIIALSLARSPSMTKMGGAFYIIPEEAHQPLEQGFVVLKSAEGSSLVLAFKDFMLTKRATDILAHFGFAKNTRLSAND